MTQFKAYPKYKDSGVEWLGEVPEHWGVSELKRYVSTQTGFAFDSKDFTDCGIPIIRISDLSFNGEVNIKDSVYINHHQLNLKIYEVSSAKNSILIAMTGGTVGKVAKYNHKEISYINQRVCAFSSLFLDEQFLWYYLNTDNYKKFVELIASGGAQPNISENQLKSQYIAIPNNKEQTQIANYLDKETAKIDALIAKQEKLIELLEEQRKSIISHAVTKGLDPNAPMKDSGVEWLGKVPEHWKISNIKRSTYLKGRVGWKGLTSNEFEVNSFAYLVTGTDFKQKYVNWSSCYQINESRYEDDPYIQLKNGDLLMTKDGTIGKLAIVKNLNKSACLNSGIFLIRPEKYYLTEFMYWVLNGNAFNLFFVMNTTGSTILHLYQNVFERFVFSYPNFKEQERIVSYLNLETAKIDVTIEKQKKLIEKLKEYRASVISHAVTGKIDVRELAA